MLLLESTATRVAILGPRTPSYTLDTLVEILHFVQVRAQSRRFVLGGRFLRLPRLQPPCSSYVVRVVRRNSSSDCEKGVKEDEGGKFRVKFWNSWCHLPFNFFVRRP